jgi:hypothetical protein
LNISPSRFRQAFDRIQRIHLEKSGAPLDSFENREPFTQEWEGYKTAIPGRAMAVMQPRRWSKKSIGSGTILESVIQAIELQGNNLLQWEAKNGPKSRVHRPLLDAREKVEACTTLETLFYNLYALNQADQTTFEAITAQCGRRYELLAYLFFIAAPYRFMPLRTTSFDKALSELGVDLKTRGQCGWENYLAFLSALRQVQQSLQAEGISDATLLHAHSFCWILARVSSDPLPSRLPAAIKPFEGKLIPAKAGGAFTPKDDAVVRDMQEEARKRQASGQIAEEVAKVAEQERLRREGRPDLAAQVENVADRPGLGYDIHSFDSDGSDRWIEVKNVSNGSRFFLSEGEWRNSRERVNFWFYLVSDIDAPRPTVNLVPALSLQPEHLAPVQYLVHFEV